MKVRLKIPDAADSPTTAPVSVTVGVDPSSTATLGADFTIVGTGATFPAGSVDGDEADVAVNIIDDDIEELAGEQAVLVLTGGTSGVAIAEPKMHSVAIQDDDKAGTTVTGPKGKAATEANVDVGPSINVALSSQPGPVVDPNNPTVEGPPADVDVHAEPDRDCTVQDDAGNVGSLGIPLTFTIHNADWKIGIDLAVRAVDDPWDEDLRNESAPHSCEIRFSFTSGDPVYENTQSDFDVPIVDNDVAGFILRRADPPVLVEGGEKVDRFTVRLKTPPDPGKPLPVTPRGPTRITVTPDAGCDAGAGPGADRILDFTDDDWNVPQTVDVTAVQNQVVELRHTCDVHLALDSPDPIYADLADTLPSLRDRIDDYAPGRGVLDDPPFVAIAANGLNVEEGQPSGDSFTAQLERAPKDDNVTVSFKTPVDPRTGQPQVLLHRGSDPPTDAVQVIFTPGNWNTPVTVNVDATDDPYDEADTHQGRIAVSIASTAVGFNDPTLRKVVVDDVPFLDHAVIPVTVTDNDTAGVVFTPTGGSTDVTEGGSGDVFKVSLSSRPRKPVRIHLVPSEDCTLDIQSIKITPEEWNSPVDVAVSAVDDTIVEGSEPCPVTVRVRSRDGTYNRVRPSPYDVNVFDND